jgi:hypothetical protein
MRHRLFTLSLEGRSLTRKSFRLCALRTRNGHLCPRLALLFLHLFEL